MGSYFILTLYIRCLAYVNKITIPYHTILVIQTQTSKQHKPVFMFHSSKPCFWSFYLSQIPESYPTVEIHPTILFFQLYYIDHHYYLWVTTSDLTTSSWIRSCNTYHSYLYSVILVLPKKITFIPWFSLNNNEKHGFIPIQNF